MYAPGNEANAVAGDVDGENKTVVITVPVEDPPLSEVEVILSEGAKIALLTDKPNPADGKVYRVTAGNGAAYSDYTVYTVWLAGAELTLTGGPALAGMNGGQITVSAEPAEVWPDALTRTPGGAGGADGSHIILTASDLNCDDYRWYVDGEQLVYYSSDEPSPRGPVVQYLGAGNYSIGKHFLLLVAIKNGVPITYRQAFNITK
jgi:hypothetical protein